MEVLVDPQVTQNQESSRIFGGAIFDFIFSTPRNYNPCQLLTESKDALIDFCGTAGWNVDYTERSTHFVPGESYRVRIFPIFRITTSEVCLIFLKKEGVILAGMHALAFLSNNHGDIFEGAKWAFSFDNSAEVPSMYRCRDGSLKVILNDASDGWNTGYHLLCITKHN